MRAVLPVRLPASPGSVPVNKSSQSLSPGRGLEQQGRWQPLSQEKCDRKRERCYLEDTLLSHEKFAGSELSPASLFPGCRQLVYAADARGGGNSAYTPTAHEDARKPTWVASLVSQLPFQSTSRNVVPGSRDHTSLAACRT